MVGKRGIEPPTSTMSTWHSNQLSYFPIGKTHFTMGGSRLSSWEQCDQPLPLQAEHILLWEHRVRPYTASYHRSGAPWPRRNGRPGASAPRDGRWGPMRTARSRPADQGGAAIRSRAPRSGECPSQTLPNPLVWAASRMFSVAAAQSWTQYRPSYLAICGCPQMRMATGASLQHQGMRVELRDFVQEPPFFEHHEMPGLFVACGRGAHRRGEQFGDYLVRHRFRRELADASPGQNGVHHAYLPLRHHPRHIISDLRTR